MKSFLIGGTIAAISGGSMVAYGVPREMHQFSGIGLLLCLGGLLLFAAGRFLTSTSVPGSTSSKKKIVAPKGYTGAKRLDFDPSRADPRDAESILDEQMKRSRR